MRNVYTLPLEEEPTEEAGTAAPSPYLAAVAGGEGEPDVFDQALGELKGQGGDVFDAAAGEIEPGNIDLKKRPEVKNPDGTVSTELSFSIGTPKGEVLIPRVVNGKVLNYHEAQQHYEATGEHLGIFKTVEAANAAAKVIHEQREDEEAAPDVFEQALAEISPEELEQRRAEIGRYGEELSPEQRQARFGAMPSYPEGAPGPEEAEQMRMAAAKKAATPQFSQLPPEVQKHLSEIYRKPSMALTANDRAIVEAFPFRMDEPTSEQRGIAEIEGALEQFGPTIKGAIGSLQRGEPAGWADISMRSFAELPRAYPEPVLQDQPAYLRWPAQTIAGIMNFPADAWNFATSPFGIATGGLGKIGGPLMHRAIGLGFTIDQLRHLKDAQNVQEAVGLTVGALAGGYGAVHPEAYVPPRTTSLRAGGTDLQWNQAEQKWVDMATGKRVLEPIGQPTIVELLAGERDFPVKPDAEPGAAAARPKWERPPPLDVKERRALEGRAQDIVDAIEDPIERGHAQDRLDKITKFHQDVRGERLDAKSDADRIRAEMEMVEYENDLRRIAGEPEVEDRPPITAEDIRKDQERQARRVKEIQGKLDRNEPITPQDRQDWRIAGQDAEKLPKEAAKDPVSLQAEIKSTGPPSLATEKLEQTLPETDTVLERGDVIKTPREEMAVRPDLMQFKAMDDSKTGTAEEARLTGEWDPDKAGIIHLWQPLDPAKYELTGKQKYLVANGHYRVRFGDEQNVKAYNTQIWREADGISLADARVKAAEINIADGKGTIYDQANLIRGEVESAGKDAALVRARRIGARGRKAASIALNAEDNLYTAFINQRVGEQKFTPEQAVAIAEAAPDNDGVQRIGLQQAARGGKDAEPDELYNFLQAFKARRDVTGQPQPTAEQGDFPGFEESPEIAKAIADGKRALAIQTEIGEQINSVRGAAKRPERAAKLGVDVKDPEAIVKRIADLTFLRERARQWSSDEAIRKIVWRTDLTPEQAVAELSALSFPKDDAPPVTPTAPTVETQTAATRAQGTQVADANGNPKIVYHGTTRTFDEFDPTKRTTSFLGAGFHFAEDPAVASRYATQEGAEGANLRPVYLDIKNAASPEIVGAVRTRVEGGGAGIAVGLGLREREELIRDELIKMGYDGLWYEHEKGYGKTWVPFEISQIKSIWAEPPPLFSSPKLNKIYSMFKPPANIGDAAKRGVMAEVFDEIDNIEEAREALAAAGDGDVRMGPNGIEIDKETFADALAAVEADPSLHEFPNQRVPMAEQAAAGRRPMPRTKDWVEQPHESALMQSAHSIQGSRERWADLRREGATDEQLNAALGYEFGSQGGFSSPDMGPEISSISYKGGKNPQITIDRYVGDRPDYTGLSAREAAEKMRREPVKRKQEVIKGKKLIDLARRTLDIPEAPPRGTPPVEERLSAAAEKVWADAKATADEFEVVDASHLSAAERKALAERGLSFKTTRDPDQIVASYPRRLRAEDLRRAVGKLGKKRKGEEGYPAPDFEFEKPESVEEQKARLAREAEEKKARDELQAKQDRVKYGWSQKKTGDTGDLGQKELIDPNGTGDLFASGTPKITGQERGAEGPPQEPVPPEIYDDPNFTALPVDLPELYRFNKQLLGIAIQVKKKLSALRGRAAGIFRHGGATPEKGEIHVRADIADLLTPDEKAALLAEARLFAERLGGSRREQEQIARERYADLLKRAYEEAKNRPPLMALKVLWHEIGHAVDWFSTEIKDRMVRGRGNIFGHIAKLHNYLKEVIALDPYKPPGWSGKAGKLPTAAEKTKMREDAEKALRREMGPIGEIVETIWVEEPDLRVLGITPEMVKDLLGMDARETMPNLYRWFAEQTAEVKKEILRKAMRGLLDERLAAMGESEVVGTRRVQRTVRRRVGREPTQDEINARFKEMFRDELKRRNLAELETVKNELKSAIAWWHGQEEMPPYFDTPSEMYAEAFSIFMNNPQALARRAPTYTRLLWNYMDKRPEVAKIYSELQNQIKAGQVHDATEAAMTDGWVEGEKKNLDRKQREAKLSHKGKDDYLDNVSYHVDRRTGPIYSAGKGATPATHAELRAAVGNFNYRATIHELIMNLMNNRIGKPLIDAGLDWTDLGRMMFYKRIISQTYAKFNPYLVTSQRAIARLKAMRESMGEDRYQKLERIHAAYRQIYETHVVKPMRDARLWSPELQKTIDEQINYATWDVRIAEDGIPEDGISRLLKMRHGDMSGYIHRLVGNAGEITNPASATLMKMLSLTSTVARNNVKRLAMKALGESNPEGTLWMPAKQHYVPGRGMQFEKVETPSVGTVAYLVDGKMEAFYVRRRLADALNKGNHFDNYVMLHLVKATSGLKAIYTQLNYGFWPVNFMLDTGGWWLKMPGFATPVHWAREFPRAMKYAHNLVKGKENPAAERVLENRVLISRADPRGIWSAAENEFELQVASYGFNPARWAKADKEVSGIVKAWNSYRELGQIVERTNKIAAWNYLERHYSHLPLWKRQEIVRERGGSPDFLQRGHAASYIDFAWLFFNPWKEEMFHSIPGAFRDNPIQFGAKASMFVVVPTIVQALAASGAMGNNMEEMHKSMDDYDLSNYMIIPLGWADREQEKVVYVRLPLPESARIMRALLWGAITGRGQGLGSLYGRSLPSMNSLLDVAQMWVGWELGGINPYDAHMGRKILDENEFKAAGWPARKKLLKESWNKLGGPIVHRFQDINIDNPPTTNIEKFLASPIISNSIGRWVKVTNRGRAQADTRNVAEQEKQRARIRLATEEIERKFLEGETLTLKEKAVLREPYAMQHIAETLGEHMMSRKSPLYRRLQPYPVEERMTILQKELEGRETREMPGVKYEGGAVITR